MRSYSKDIFTNAGNWKNIRPIGLAKDGNIIYGPFDKDGKEWLACNVDICNGIMMNGYYSYVTTSFFPYILGCFGPGNNPGVNVDFT